MNMLSLGPYLDSNATKIFLKLSLAAEDTSQVAKSPFPFLVMSDSSPLCRLIEAQFVTDHGSRVRKVFLLVQRDHYLVIKDELRPIGNQDVDNFWQEAFLLSENGQKDCSFISISHQVIQRGPREHLVPFQSLFFCKHKQLFFTPPCPTCGLTLQQCYDDSLLSSSGLQLYSTSLKRYLYCPSCSASGGSSLFYAYELEGSDPPHHLKNRWDLIKGFGSLLEREINPGQLFPCRSCHESYECYGPNSQVLARVVPFSFYPFHMLIFESMSLHALDFLALISGASFEELEAQLKMKHEFGRISCLTAIQQNFPGKALIFYEESEKYFLEVLYLKLSFLSDLFQKSLSWLDIHRHPDLELSLDRVWVKLADHASELPFFWSFSVRTLDIGRIGHDPREAPLPPRFPFSYNLYLFGLAWFCTLLVNREQDVSRVYKSLGRIISESPQESRPLSTDDFIKDKLDQVFLPESIFWNHQGEAVNRSWYPFWERALNLGWFLVHTSLRSPSPWSEEEFRQQLESLRREVKKALFHGESSYKTDGTKAYVPEGEDKAYVPEGEDKANVPQGEAPAYMPKGENKTCASKGEDEALHRIILKVMSKWGLEADAGKAELAGKDRLDNLEEKGGPAFSPAENKGERIPETVIISPSEAGQILSGDPSRPQAGKVEGDRKTSSGAGEKEPWRGEEQSSPQEPAESPTEDSQDDFMAETIILKPEKSQNGS